MSRVFLGCSGFPVPVSRYWAEVGAVEIAETELGIPGEGTVRRWAREAPDRYGFALLAPKAITAGGLSKSKDGAALLDAMGGVARKLSAQAIVFALPEVKPARGAKGTLAAFAKWVAGQRLPAVVFDLPSWPAKDLAAALEGTGVLPAIDPLRADAPAAPSAGDLHYLRLAGPAGHRSRYDDAMLERIAAHLRASRAKTTFCTFTNVDCLANAKRVTELLAQQT